MEQTTFNIWHQSQSKKRGNCWVSPSRFLHASENSLFCCCAWRRDYKILSAKKKSSVFSDSVHKTASRWQLCAVVSDGVFSGVFNAFGDILVHFNSLGFGKALGKATGTEFSLSFSMQTKKNSPKSC